MPRRSSRSLGCAVAARRLLPLPLKRQPQPQTLPVAGSSLQGGLEREAAVGRRRRECDFVGIKGAPSSPRSSSESGLAPRQFQSHSCWRRAMSNPVLAPWRFAIVASSCGRSATVRRPPKVSRSMFRVPAEPGILTSSGMESLPPAGTLHARQSLRFVPVMESCSPTPCAASAPSSLRPRQETSVRRRVRPTKKESLHAPPKVGDRLRSLPRGLEIDQES